MALKTKRTASKKGGVKLRTSGKTASTSSIQDFDMDTPKPKKRFSYKYLVFFVFLVLLLSALYLLKGYFVAAMVNGRPIMRLELIKELEKSSGQQTLDSLVTKEMLMQEARKKNVSVQDDEVTQELDKLTKQLEQEGTTLDAALAVRGMNRQSFEENLRVQKLVEKLLVDTINVSDEESLKYFNENKQFMAKDAKYEDLKEDLKLQLKQEKLDVEYEKLYNKLKGESDIKYFVTF